MTEQNNEFIFVLYFSYKMINWNNVFILIYQEAVPIMAIAMADVIMEEDITALTDTVDAATNCYTLKSTIK